MSPTAFSAWEAHTSTAYRQRRTARPSSSRSTLAVVSGRMYIAEPALAADVSDVLREPADSTHDEARPR
ncbi:hypothetical protein [Nocardioides aurantiacus]|uniref:hypothetical protein n=1 Tax=Nocardioides aurantiacus TaxID=86796 RepID=UPI0011CE6BCE|nr:hypothetical protein [Nocardioides aurantiacus]